MNRYRMVRRVRFEFAGKTARLLPKRFLSGRDCRGYLQWPRNTPAHRQHFASMRCWGPCAAAKVGEISSCREPNSATGSGRSPNWSTGRTGSNTNSYSWPGDRLSCKFLYIMRLLPPFFLPTYSYTTFSGCFCKALSSPAFLDTSII